MMVLNPESVLPKVDLKPSRKFFLEPPPEIPLLDLLNLGRPGFGFGGCSAILSSAEALDDEGVKCFFVATSTTSHM